MIRYGRIVVDPDLEGYGGGRRFDGLLPLHNLNQDMHSPIKAPEGRGSVGRGVSEDGNGEGRCDGPVAGNSTSTRPEHQGAWRPMVCRD